MEPAEPAMQPAPAPPHADVDNDEQQLANLRKFLSVNSRMCIPFVSMNYFERTLLAFYVVIHVLSFAYKYNRLVYPSYASTTELLMLSLFVLTQLIRFEFARKAVNNRDGDNMRSYLIVSVLVVLAYVFFLRLQTYVTMLEVLTNSVGIGWTAIQIGLALWLVVIFYKKGKIV